MKEFLLVIICYLVGSIPFSYIVSRRLGRLISGRPAAGTWGYQCLTLSRVGSSNSGGSRRYPEGVFAAWLAAVMGGGVLLLLCPLAAVVGHCYPVYLRFRGGKGVATSTGALLFLTPYSILYLFFAFVGVVGLSRIVSLGSLTAAVFIPFVTMFLYPQERFVIILTFLLAILVIYRHKDNIRRLLAGKEPRIGEKV